MEKDQILKLTVPKLREEALKIGGISGVHGMNKAQLVEGLFEHFGIVMEEKAKKKADPEIKKTIKAMRDQKDVAQKAGENDRAKILQRKIHRLKRLTRI